MARDYYEVLGRPAGRERRGDPAGVPQAGPPATTPTSTRTRRRRSGSRRSTRPTRCCPTPRPAQRYDRFGAGLPADPRGLRRAGGRGPGGSRARGAALGGGAVGCGFRSGFGIGSPAASTSRTCSAACSAAGGGGPDPRRRPGGRAGADRRGGVPRRPAADHPRRSGRAARATRSTSRPGSSTASASGWPGRAGGVTATAPPGDLYLVVRIKPHPRYRLDGRDITVDLPVVAVGGGAGRHRSGHHARRRGQGRGPAGFVDAAGGCGCAARACPTRRARRATSTPRSGSWCRRTHRAGARAVRAAGRGVRRSTRGAGR